MATVFEVQSLDIKQLNDLNLTKLLKMLLHLEARQAGIDERTVDVALNIRVADGGEDGRIEWKDGPEKTNFLPLRLVQFQNKATDMSPAACASELVDTQGKLKPMVEQALEAGGAYVLFTTQELNKQQKSIRIRAIRTKLQSLCKSYWDTAIIEIYDASSIQGWVNHYVSAITAVLNWVGKPIIHGLHTWDEWEGFNENHHFKYVTDGARQAAIHNLRSILSQPNKCARIIGLSGLGKTRLALEVCRGDSNDDGFRNRVVYIDAACGESNLAGLVHSWNQLELDVLLVVDNCELNLHKQLRREIEHSKSLISLLTLHYNSEKDSDTHPIQLNKMSDDLIKAMLEPIYAEKITDLDRIVSFAQGFPQMAVLLTKARLEKTRDMGSLTDDDLVKKMLWGGETQDQQSKAILEACSLFDKFGIQDEMEEEAKFIAEEIAGTDLDTLYRCITEYQDRGVINRAGRLAQIIPKPLAIRLAADWWRSTRINRQKELIGTQMPGQLQRSFCEQIAKLDFLPEVKELTQNLCGNQGPFGQVEVILSDRGSRLFRSLVEVNPLATSDVLFRTLSDFSYEKLYEISGDIRRNLVWALEKLCFHRDVFEKSAKCLLWLASAENEDWANNATGQFLQLFKTFLSGTEAEPELRLHLVDELISNGNEFESKLAVRALESAIETYGGTRTIGAEYQGSGQPLVEWRPKIWKEAFDYWTAAIERLALLALSENELGIAAKDAIASHIRGLIQSSREVMMALDSAIREIVTKQGPFWPRALDSVKTALSYDSEKMPDELKDRLQEWIGLLTPSTLKDRISLIVSMPPYEHEKGDDGHYIDVSQVNVENFAKEFRQDINALSPYLPELLNGEQRQAFWFGRNLVLTSGKYEPLLSEAIAQIQKMDVPNMNLIFGMLAGLYQIDPEHWSDYIGEFKNNINLNHYYPEAIRTGKIGIQHLDSVIELIESEKISVSRASVFTHGRPLDHLKPLYVIEFVERLRKISTTAAWISLDILTMYCHGNEESFENCAQEFRMLLIDLPIDQGSVRNTMDSYYWSESVKRLLSKEDSEFAVMITQQILRSSGDKLDYGDKYHYIKPIMRTLLREYGQKVWPIIADAIRNADSLNQYYLSQLLTKEDSFSNQQTSVLAELSDDILHQWCRTEPNLAPIFMARSTDVYIEEEDTYELSPRALFLLDEFGENKKMLSELSANMGSFGWVGSIVPIYKKEVAALESLLQHRHRTVRQWVLDRIEYLNRSIQKETMHDEEHGWGE